MPLDRDLLYTPVGVHLLCRDWFDEEIPLDVCFYVTDVVQRDHMRPSPEPIDRVALRLTHFEQYKACPYCKRNFRNNAALRLHVIESHGVTENPLFPPTGD